MSFSSIADRSADPLKISARSSRLSWLDAAKAYGMFLVYYGHFVERIADLQGFVVKTAAFSQYKFIYAFHMPLFFILSGFVYRDKEQTFSSFLTHRFLTRLLPALFFNVVAVGIQLLESVVAGDASFSERYQDTNVWLDLLSGYPFGNIVTWFLVCLFTVELFNYVAQPLLRDHPWRRVGVAGATLVAGYYLGIYQGSVTSLPLRGLNTWYVNEALIGFSFYQIGFLLKQSKCIELLQHSFYRYVGLGVTLAATVALFDLNQGPFTDARALVLMAAVSHGNFLLFEVTALCGSLWVICLALCMCGHKLITFVGQNTLILLGLNFLFAGFTKPLASKIGLAVFDSGWTVLVFCTALTLVSFVASAPLIWLLQKYLPQLIGKPKANGPLLPQLLRS